MIPKLVTRGKIEGPVNGLLM